MAKKPKKIETYTHPLAMHIYTDGSFRPPDCAACAYVIFSEKTQHIVDMRSYAFRGKTINQMELKAISLALDHPNTDYVVIYSDSQYSINCLTVWIKGWERSNWKNPHGEDIKNRELIEEIYRKMKLKKHVSFVKVAAHTGDKLNSIADYLASSLTKRMMSDETIINKEYGYR